MRTIQLIVVHSSRTRCDRRLSVEDLIAYHNARYGFTAYHYYITRNGTTYQTRHENLPGAHAKGYDQHAIGICYEGGLTPEGRQADTRTPSQKRALKALIAALKADYPRAHVLGHRDLPLDCRCQNCDCHNLNCDCRCPSDDIYDCPGFDAEAEYNGSHS